MSDEPRLSIERIEKAVREMRNEMLRQDEKIAGLLRAMEKTVRVLDALDVDLSEVEAVVKSDKDP